MRARRRPSRSALVLRWLAAAVLAAIALAYVPPLRAYWHARHQLAERREEVAALERTHRELERSVAEARSVAFVEREARKLALVRPGERLFIVTRDQGRDGAPIR
jgi:cell division protein FtsB